MVDVHKRKGGGCDSIPDDRFHRAKNVEQKNVWLLGIPPQAAVNDRLGCDLLRRSVSPL